MAKNTSFSNGPNTSLAPGRVILAMISGAMLTASFPPFNLSFLAWFALLPLLKSIEHGSSLKAFKLGFIAGTVHFLSLIYWIVVVLGRYGGLNIFLSVILTILLCLYLSLYLGVFSFLTNLSSNSRLFVFWVPCFWCSLEYARAKFLSGFPWCLLGYSQYEHLILIQIADIFGVYGISFLLVLVNALIYRLFLKNADLRSKKQTAGRMWQSFGVSLLLGLTLFYGHNRLSEPRRDQDHAEQIRTVVIQGNIDQAVKWDPGFQSQTLDSYIQLTQNTLDFNPDLIVWPETAVPFFFQDHEELSPKIMSLVKESETGLIFGSPAYKKIDGLVNYYNRAYLISTGIRQLQYYDKLHLVPFGEYVPLKKILWFVNRLVPAAGDFKAGEELKPMKLKNLSMGVLICFEAIFPELARAYAQRGVHVLVNLTNDAWFGKTSAPHQHLAMAAFRAVENRMPMIRAANTGFSAFIQEQGKIVKRSGLFSKETLTDVLEIPESRLTFYGRFGDLFSLLLSGAALIKLFSLLKPNRSD